MKQQLQPTSHDRHDVMLIVRLYGGDVSDHERETALGFVADCGDCAQLLADLAAITDATKLMATPPRPRDFTLTEADAARLGRTAGAGGRFGWVGLRRSLGGALAALGLVGVLLSGTSSLLSPVAHSSSQERAAFDSNSATAAPANAAGLQPSVAVYGGASIPPQYVAGSSPLPSPGGNPVTVTQPTPNPAAASPGDKSAGGTATDTSTTGGGSQLGPVAPTGTSNGVQPGTIASRSDSGTDSRPIALLGFGLALLIGLALLVGPRFGRLAARAVRR